MANHGDGMDYYALRVGDLMTPEVVTLAVFEDMAVAAQLMREGAIRHLPVVDDEGKLVGLVTHRDLLRVSESSERPLSDEERTARLTSLPVRDVMHRDVLIAYEGDPLEEAAQRMIARKVGCLPVVDARARLVGIVTEADFVALTIRLVALGRGEK